MKTTPHPCPAYVLMTPAHNEADYISQTIESVINQTWKPQCWVIISDRSSDKTDEIVSRYATEHDFIHLIRRTGLSGRDTAGKVGALNLGLSFLATYDYEFIGNLDADIAFEPDYFKRLLTLFDQEPRLGLTGGRIYHGPDQKRVEYQSAIESVPGAVQLFRRVCFEKIGGYQPIKGGMEDSVAELTVRYYGWETRSIKGLVAIHLRPIGLVDRSIWQTRFNDGINHYKIGYRYYYHLLRLLFYLHRPPLLLGSLLTGFGYLYGWISRQPLIINSPALLAFQRLEQRQRVFHHFKRLWEKIR